RAGGVQRRYMNERGFTAVDRLAEVAQAHEASVAQVAIAWVLANSAVASAIIGANSVAQLEETLKGAALRLAPEQKEALDAATAWE
ncbi:MAG: aldo/keto reductase, partial [Anaerolineales bacterium]|nr:aldo/keto reductase [Anaerolineales bacterium]